MTTPVLTLESLAADVADVNRRVGVLYNVARAAVPDYLRGRLESATTAPTPEYTPEPDAPQTDAQSDDSSTGERTPLDYGAIAFGLSEMKRKIESNFSSSVQLDNEFRGSVQWFSDVFALADPSFDADRFRRDANA